MRYTIVRVRGSDAKLEQALADAKSGKRKKRQSLRVLTTLLSLQSSNENKKVSFTCSLRVV